MSSLSKGLKQFVYIPFGELFQYIRRFIKFCVLYLFHYKMCTTILSNFHISTVSIVETLSS
jgi:hypothetical protein